MAMQRFVDRMDLYGHPRSIYISVRDEDLNSDFDFAHPLWQENETFVDHARKIHGLLLKEKLGLYLEVEDWFKEHFDVSWITWDAQDPYPEDAMWNDLEYRPMNGNCIHCAKTHQLWQPCCLGTHAIVVPAPHCLGNYYNPLFISKLFGAPVVLPASPGPSGIDKNGTFWKWDVDLGNDSRIQLHLTNDDVPLHTWEVLHHALHHPPNLIGDDFHDVDYLHLSNMDRVEQAKAWFQRWVDKADAFLLLKVTSGVHK